MHAYFLVGSEIRQTFGITAPFSAEEQQKLHTKYPFLKQGEEIQRSNLAEPISQLVKQERQRQERAGVTNS